MEKFCGNRDCDNSFANFVCSRCQSEFYCSKKCQIDAFVGHRHNCFELPPLRPITSNDLHPKVSMMSLTSGNKELQVIYSKEETEKQQVPVVIKKKEEVAVPPVPERQVKRAPTPVISKQSEEVSAHETKKPEEVVVPEKKPVEVVSQPKASNLREFPEPEPVERKVPEKDVKPKSSFVPSVIYKQQQPPKEVEDPRFYYKDLKQRPLPTKEFTANFLFGEIEKKIFSIVDSANAPILEAVDAIVTEVTKDNAGKPYAPKKDELVLAKFEGTYYRAVCKEVQRNAYLMNYIDYGNEAIVLEQGIRKFNKKLMEFDVVVHQCYMENFPDKIDEKVSTIMSQEDGIKIVNATKGTKEGTFVAQILGL